jgi:hypothetical protein
VKPTWAPSTSGCRNTSILGWRSSSGAATPLTPAREARDGPEPPSSRPPLWAPSTHLQRVGLLERRGRAGRLGSSRIVSAQGPTRVLPRTEPTGAHLGVVARRAAQRLVCHLGEQIAAKRQCFHELAGVNNQGRRLCGFTRQASCGASL